MKTKKTIHPAFMVAGVVIMFLFTFIAAVLLAYQEQDTQPTREASSWQKIKEDQTLVLDGVKVTRKKGTEFCLTVEVKVNGQTGIVNSNNLQPNCDSGSGIVVPLLLDNQGQRVINGIKNKDGEFVRILK